MSRKFFTLWGAIIALLLIPSTVFATYPLTAVNSATFYCDAVVINYTIGTTSDPISFHIINGGPTHLGSQVHGTIAGNFNMTIPISPTQSAGTTLHIFARYGNDVNYYSPSGTTTGNCSGLIPVATQTEISAGEEIPPPPPAEPVYRLFGSEGARASIMIQAEENGTNNPIFTLYNINEASQGNLLFYISLNTLNSEYPADAGVNTLIYENPEEFITLYRLATGELQVNLGPDNEGKMHVIRFNWDGGDPYNVVYETYFVSSYRFEWAGLLSSSILSR